MYTRYRTHGLPRKIVGFIGYKEFDHLDIFKYYIHTVIDIKQKKYIISTYNVNRRQYITKKSSLTMKQYHRPYSEIYYIHFDMAVYSYKRVLNPCIRDTGFLVLKG